MAPNGKKPEGIKLEDLKEDTFENDNKVEQMDLSLPDGGYGWVVVMASFLTHLIVDGMIYSYGVFFREFNNEFDCGTGFVAGLGSLLSGTCLLTAPLAAALINMYNCKKVVMAGSVVAFIGFFFASFSPNIAFMIPFFGIIGGIGYGLMFLPMVVIVSYYFDKKRAIATCIAVSGSGVGIFICAPFCRWMLETYDWRNVLVIISGLNLQGLWLGALLRPIKPSIKPPFEEVSSVNEGEYLDPKAKEDSLHALNFNVGPTDENDDGDIVINLDLVSRKASMSEPPDHRFIPMQRKDIFYSGSVLNIPEFLRHANLMDYTRSITSISRTLSLATINTKIYLCNCIPVSPLFKETISQMTDISLLKDRVFAIICIANFFGALGLFIPFVYLSDRALSYNIPPQQATFLLSVIGICNIFGRFLCGVLASIRWFDTTFLHNVSLLASGVACIATTFFHTYNSFCFFSVVFGLSFAFFVSISPTLLCNLLGLEKLTNAYGIIIMVRGIATLLGTPLVGIFYDLFQNLDLTFHIAGVFILMGGFVSLLLHCTPQRRW